MHTSDEEHSSISTTTSIGSWQAGSVQSIDTIQDIDPLHPANLSTF